MVEDSFLYQYKKRRTRVSNASGFVKFKKIGEDRRRKFRKNSLLRRQSHL